MTELLDYQPRLNEQYDKALDGKDARSFFSHLYLYLQTIHTNSTLLELANREVSKAHAELYPEDAEDMPNLANGQSPNPMLISAWLTHSLTGDKGQVQLFYCWLRLFLFYSIRKYPLDKNNAYSKQPQYKLNVLIINNEFSNIFKKNSDSDNHLFKVEQYRLCLDIFHPWFIQCLTDNAGTVAQIVENTANDNQGNVVVEPAQTTQTKKIPKEDVAELDFHGLATPIVRYRGIEYTFETLDEKYDPWKIVSYCWDEKPNDEVRINELRTKADVSAPRGIKEALRKAPYFKKGGGALNPFIYGLSSKSVTVKKRTPLNNGQLEIIKSSAIKANKISK